MSDPPIIINLGIDFGTKYTKVCYKDSSRDTIKIVNFGGGSGILEGALLDSAVYVHNKNGQLHLAAGFTAAESAGLSSHELKRYEYLKMRLAFLDHKETERGWYPRIWGDLDRPEAVEAICAHFLTCVISRARKWISAEEADVIKGRTVSWTANVGVPVQFCDSPSLERFRRVLTTAWRLSEEDLVDETGLTSVIDRCKRLECSPGAALVDIGATPELAAAIDSFRLRRDTREGVYTFFDIGAGTLDGLALKYLKIDGEPRINCLFARVKSLGVIPVAEEIAANTRANVNAIAQSLFLIDSHQLAPDAKDAMKGIRILVSNVVLRGKKKDLSAFNEISRLGRLLVLLGGGGARSDFFQSAISGTYKYMNHWNYDIPPYSISEIGCPADFVLNGVPAEHFYRFIIAHGLSTFHSDIAELYLPSQFNEQIIVRRKRRNIGGDYLDSKDCD